MSTIKEKLNNTREEIKKDFQLKLKELQNEFPFINSFSWKQYTPYFNDGEECVFRAGTSKGEIYINNIDIYGEYNYNNIDLTYKQINIIDNYYKDENQILIKEYELKESLNKDDLNKYKNIIELSDEFNKLNIDSVNEYLKIKSNIEYLKSFTKEKKEYLYNKVSSTIEEIDDDDLLFIFGDHAFITISNEGIEIETYEHD